MSDQQLDTFKKLVDLVGQAEAARVSGLSPATINQVYHGKYQADQAGVINIVLGKVGGKIVKQVPEGYKADAKGRLVPVEMISQANLSRDELVYEIVGKARQVAAQVAEFKKAVLGDIEAFAQLSAEKYGVSLGGIKGNLVLTSFDGKYRVLRAVDERQEPDERLQAAKALIDQCLEEWTSDSRPELKTLIDRVFREDNQGRINTKQLLALRQYDIDDARWRQAMQAIADSLQVIGSSVYIRIYERDDETGKYRQMPLDVSAA
ncbi:MAG: DUF3164 family protein [Thermodesulfobacteriota bacterium]